MTRGYAPYQPTFAECVARGKAAGWPDYIGIDDHAEEVAALDRLGEVHLTMRQTSPSKLPSSPEFKSLTAATREPSALRRLALTAAQVYAWHVRAKSQEWLRAGAAHQIIETLLGKPKLTGDDGQYVLAQLKLICGEACSRIGGWLIVSLGPPAVANAAALVAGGHALPDEARPLLEQLRKMLSGSGFNDKCVRAAVRDIGPLLGESDAVSARLLRAGEPWADAARADIATDREKQSAWDAILEHAIECNATKPNAKWIERAKKLIEPIGADVFIAHADRWLARLATAGPVGRQVVHQGDTYNNVPCDTSQDVLVGLAWAVATLKDAPQAMRVIADLAEVSYRPIPRFGPRCVKLGGAAVRALASVGTLDAVGQLARLELRVRTPKGRKLIQKVLSEAIIASGLSRQDVEETSVPDFGLGDGKANIPVGDWTAELDATHAYDPKLTWRKPDGSVAKSCAVIKKSHPAGVESAQRVLKDIEGMLPAQRTRLELLLRDTRTWRLDEWRRRYLAHGLLSPMVRRLIWTVDGTPVLFADSGAGASDVSGKLIPFGESAEVAIWHPVGRAVDEIVAWRRRLEELRISQPFKQAHREVYLVTDAELNTQTYSNRFAAHIVKTPTFIAIGQTRKWKVTLFGQATIELPQFDLRAEYWANEAGDIEMTGRPDRSYGPAYLATDQVRFYRGRYTEPMPVADVPPLAFSEVMRDCDLFVGIASVGADPNWTDGGNDRYRAYWQSYSFGDLTESAKTRKAVLERLVPRLKIAELCSLTDKFLRVKGKIRAYKIHLGSGNILMEPNDQYLCIVPARGAQGGTSVDGNVFLPFEGDPTLSVILSKAFLLADDSSISDPTITRQIRQYV